MSRIPLSIPPLFLLLLLSLSHSYRTLVRAASESGQDSSNAGKVNCNATSLCLPCSQQQKDEDPLCRSTGYRQSIRCLKVTKDESEINHERGNSGNREGENDRNDPRNRRRMQEVVPFLGSLQAAASHLLQNRKGERVRGESKESYGGEGRVVDRLRRHLLKIGSEEKLEYFNSFQSCFPEQEDTLSVLNFEGIMLLILGLCGRIVYQRKKRGAANTGMTSVPSNPRF